MKNVQKNIEIVSQDKVIAFKRISKKFGTPLYVYFEKDLKDSFKNFQKIRAPYGLIVRYAIKANSNGAILRFYNKLGAHFDASTFNECVRLIEGAGISGNKIRLTSQEVQSEENLHYLTKKSVLYTACSLLQLETYGKALPNTEVGIRFNIGIGSALFPTSSTGGKNSSFGIFEQRDKINALLNKYNLTLTTVHVHIGSGSDSEKQKIAVHEGLKIVNDYPHVVALSMGGGYKVGGMSSEHSTNIKEVGQVMVDAIKDFNKTTGRKILLEMEPGTALVAKAGYILTEIIDKVTTGSSGKEFLKVNGGMNMNARVPMHGAQHPLIVIPRKRKNSQIKEYVVCGICCESGDILTVELWKPGVVEQRSMVEACVGDLMVIGRAGAYCASMSGGNYNSQQLHPEILVRENGKLDVIRERQPLSDIWKYEKIPRDL
jgi:diaminopimelate decarboxylase